MTCCHSHTISDFYHPASVPSLAPAIQTGAFVFPLIYTQAHQCLSEWFNFDLKINPISSTNEPRLEVVFLIISDSLIMTSQPVRIITAGSVRVQQFSQTSLILIVQVAGNSQGRNAIGPCGDGLSAIAQRFQLAREAENFARNADGVGRPLGLEPSVSTARYVTPSNASS